MKSALFKRIRNRIMLQNMIMVSAVVIAAFTVIFIIVYAQEQDSRRTKLLYGDIPQTIIASGTAIRHEGYFIDTDPAEARPVEINPADSLAPAVTVSGFARRIDPGEGLSFSLIVDDEGSIIEVNSVVNLPETAYGQAALEASENHAHGAVVELEGRIWQYSASAVTVGFQEIEGATVFIAGEYNDIRFLDVTDSVRMLKSLGLTMSSIMIFILAAFFFISRFFANRAIRPMEEAFDKQSRFVADASHELKTPLSIINANCGVLYSNESEVVATQKKWIDSILRATGRITELTNTLLSLTNMEGSASELCIGSVDLSKLVLGTLTDFEPSILKKGLVLEKCIDANIVTKSDVMHIEKILAVLLDNAVKYTDSGGTISVSTYMDRLHIIIAVRNSGSGIPKDELPSLFDRFYRGDPARSSETEGYGLGLAIAKSAADRLGAGLTVGSEPGQYTEFRIIL